MDSFRGRGIPILQGLVERAAVEGIRLDVSVIEGRQVQAIQWIRDHVSGIVQVKPIAQCEDSIAKAGGCITE